LPRPWLRQSPGARRRSRSCWVSLGRVVAPTPVRQLLPAGHAVLGKLQPDARVRQRSVPTQDSSTEQHAYGPHDVNPYKPLRSLKKGRNGSAQLGTGGGQEVEWVEAPPLVAEDAPGERQGWSRVDGKTAAKPLSGSMRRPYM
jgi:hypothetical protein